MTAKNKRAFIGGRVWSPKDEFVRTVVSKSEIEARLDSTVSRLVKQGEQDSNLSPGWTLMPLLGVDFIQIGDAKIPFLDENKASMLIDLAQRNCHAFDLAQHISATQIFVLKANGTDMCPSLTQFGAEVLNGERKRPTQKGRPRSQDTYFKMWQYLISKFIVATTTLRLTRNDASQGEESFSACDAVADAFSRAGHNTTYTQVKSVCFDKGNRDLRELLDYLGLTEGLWPG